MDTLEANLTLGFAGDEREYYIGAQILRDLGISDIRLLTNNPDKIYQLKRLRSENQSEDSSANGGDCSRPLYLKTKQVRMGHIFKLLKNISYIAESTGHILNY